MAKRTTSPVWLESYRRWQIKVSKDSQRKTFTSYTPGRKGCIECQKKADAWLENDIINFSIRVSTLADMWIEELKLRTSFDHWKQYEGYCNNYIKPRIGARRVSSLTEQHLQDVILWAYTHPKSKNHKELSYKTLDNLRDCISAFIKYARKNKVTTLLPEDLRVPNHARRSEKMPLQPNDLKKLFSVDTTLFRGKRIPEWYIHAYRFFIITGLRPGELAALQDKRDINGQFCTVRESINIHGKVTRGKNQRAQRFFALPNHALLEIEAQRAMLKAAGIISPYLFPNENGEHIVYKTFAKRWYRYRDYNGLSSRTLYEMRHTWFSLNQNAPEQAVKRMGGHGKNFDTFGTYGHPIDGDAKIMVSYIDKILQETLAK